MTATMPADAKRLKLGELLIAAGILSPEQLSEAMEIAKETELPVGRILTMRGYLKDCQLSAAVQAQSLMRDQLLDENTAFQALVLITSNDPLLEVALAKVGWVRKAGVTHRLGELLRQADLISQKQLDEGLRGSKETGLPLGRILVLTRVLSEDLLALVLSAQSRIRDGVITRDAAIEELKQSYRKGMGEQRSLVKRKISLQGSDLLSKILTFSGLIPEKSLRDALRCHYLCERGLLSLEQAIVLLNHCKQTGENVDDALASFGWKNVLELP